MKRAHFYDTVLAPLGGHRVMDFGGTIGYGTDFPSFWIGADVTGEGLMESHIAFTATSRDAVQSFFAAAVADGAEILHEPRLWPEYHESYFGASSATPTATTSKPSATPPHPSRKPRDRAEFPRQT